MSNDVAGIPRLAVLAPEFPPELGGMAELAWGLADALAEHTDLHLYTRSGLGVGDPPFTVHPLLGSRPWRDRGALRRAEPAAPWLILNAGYAPLAKQLGRPFYAYVHGNDFLNPWTACGPPWLERIRRPYMAVIRHALRRRAIRGALGAARRVFVNSRNTGDLVAHRMALDPGRIEVCPPGVHELFFQDPPPKSSDEVRLLTVCRLTRYTARKNVDGVLEALALLGPRPFHYTVVGDGDDRPRLEALARRLGLGERVSFRGSLDRDGLLDAYRHADLFILAAKATAKDVEGFGIVYLEASAAGVPVLASREGGAVDAVDEGVNGLLIPTSSPSDIAAGIERFLAERERWPAERVRGFAEGFRWPRIAERLFAFLCAAEEAAVGGETPGGE